MLVFLENPCYNLNDQERKRLILYQLKPLKSTNYITRSLLNFASFIKKIQNVVFNKGIGKFNPLKIHLSQFFAFPRSLPRKRKKETGLCPGPQGFGFTNSKPVKLLTCYF